VVQRVIDEAGHAPGGVEDSDEVLEGKEAELVEEWADALVMAGHRAQEAQRASP
jgi:hypothetical protein